MQSAPQDATTLHNELCALVQVLAHLRDFLDDEETNALGNAFEKSSALVAAVDLCAAEITALRVKLRAFKLKPGDGRTLRQKWERLRWPFQKDEIVQTVCKLRHCTQIFHFSLSISQW